MPFGNISIALAKAFMLTQLSVCPIPTTVPHVDIIFLDEKPTYITEAPIKALTNEMRGNPDSTIATDSRWIVYGLTTAGVGGGSFHVSFSTLSDQSGNTCLSVDKVDFIISYSPTVFLAKELAPYACRFKMVKLHEERHVATDIRTINEYIPKIKMDMLWYLRSVGMQGPYPRTDLPKQQRALMEQIVGAAKPMITKLVAIRRQRQGAIDTIENYRQEAALCPGEAPTIGDDKAAPADAAAKPVN